jgi:NADPH:quinone reductase-like Zn-dependent oxidoreductase
VVGEVFAHRVVTPTGPDGLVWTEAEEPRADGGVVIEVVAAGVSYADLLQTTGDYQLKVSMPFSPAWTLQALSAPRLRMRA